MISTTDHRFLGPLYFYQPIVQFCHRNRKLSLENSAGKISPESKKVRLTDFDETWHIHSQYTNLSYVKIFKRNI